MLASLKETFAAELRTTDGWQIFSDPEDPDAQSLLVEYPSNSSKTGYIRPLVKNRNWSKVRTLACQRTQNRKLC